MKKMPKNDSYASGEYPEDFCIRVRTPFSPWDTEFSFFASRDSRLPGSGSGFVSSVPIIDGLRVTGVLASNGAIPEILRTYKPYLASLAFPAFLRALASVLILLVFFFNKALKTGTISQIGP